MATHQLDMAGYIRFIRSFGERGRAAVQRGLLAGAWHCIPILQRRTEEAIPASPNGSIGAFSSGNYRMSWKVRQLESAVAVYNSAPYANIIEEGRRPGRRGPPRRVIEQWMVRKLGVSEEEAKRASYPIARAIGRRGLRGRHVLGGATDQLKRVVRKDVIAEVMKLSVAT